MKEGARPQINASKIVSGGGIAGAIFTVGNMLIILAGLPVLRYMFLAAIGLGCGLALALRFIRHKTPGAPWILSATEKRIEAPSQLERKEDPERSNRIFLDRPVIGRAYPAR
jgi:hypothetical protein